MFRYTKPFAAVVAMTIVLKGSAAGVPPMPASSTETDRIVHLLNRAAFGPRLGDVERVRRTGVAEYIDAQLHPELIHDEDGDQDDAQGMATRLASFDTLKLDVAATWAKYSRAPKTVVDQLQASKVVRAIHSPKQLEEVMVDFWFNHFNVYAGKADMAFLVTSYERDAIRPHALGRFKDLLEATAKHPAMLVYLDNALSSAPEGVNENYARELMELHTMGVDGGYTQKDVEEVARVFTGWTINRSSDGFPFEFRSSMHDTGEKTVLGRKIPPAGLNEGETVLDALSEHPSTARFIATKLVRRFVADDPPASLVERAAAVFSKTDGDIRAVVRTILTSEEFFAPETFRAKVKTPFEVVVSTVRAVDAGMAANVDSRVILAFQRGLPTGAIEITKVGARFGSGSPVSVLVQQIQDMGQLLYQYEEPTGYPDRGEYWMGGWSLLHRLNFTTALMENRVLGTSVDLDRLGGLLGGAPAEDSWKNALAVVTGAQSSPADRGTTPSADEVTKAFVLALGSPQFQHK